MAILDRLRVRFARGRLARRVASNAGWMLADRALRMGIGFVVGVWAARYLGPHDFGQLSYALAIAGLSSMLVDLALEGVVVSALLARPAQAHVILGTAFWLREIDGLSAEEAAHVLGVSRNTLKARLWRARQELAARLGLTLDTNLAPAT